MANNWIKISKISQGGSFKIGTISEIASNTFFAENTIIPYRTFCKCDAKTFLGLFNVNKRINMNHKGEIRML